MPFDAVIQGARYSRAVASTTCAMWTNLWVQCCVCGGGSDDLAMIIHRRTGCYSRAASEEPRSIWSQLPGASN